MQVTAISLAPLLGLTLLYMASTLSALLTVILCLALRSQLYLSRQLAQLHPELTMPMFRYSSNCSILQIFILMM